MTSIGTVAFASQIAAAAQRHGVDPLLLAAVAAQETGGPGASSGRNITGDGGHGHGVFQIDDRYHAFAATPAAADPGKNADYAAGLLHGLLQKFGGNVRAALSAYNAGSPTATGTVTSWGGGLRLGYADSVLRHRASLGGAAAAGTALTATARDAAVPDLADTAARVNGLQTLALGSAAQPAAAATQPPAALPAAGQQSTAQRAHSEAALTQDYYADGDDADTKGA